MNQRTANEIERDIARTRAEMSETIDAIQERLSPGQLFEQLLHYFSSGRGRGVADGASAFALNLGRTMRDNPVPVALVTTGLAWLMVAQARRSARGVYEPYDEYEEYDRLEEEQVARYGSTEELAERYDERMARREKSALHEPSPAFGDHPKAHQDRPEPVTQPSGAAGAGPAAQPGSAGHRTGGSVGAASVSDMQGGGGNGGGDDPGDRSRSPGDRARDAADEARFRAGRVAEDARRQAAHAGGAGRARGEDARAWAEGAAGQARERMHHASERWGGSGDSSGGATRRGRRDWSARRQAKRARSGFSHLLEERPLLIGAIGLAIGAALGTLLPPTRREDEWLGETRDNLRQRARAEVGKAERVVERAVDTARSQAEEQELTPEGARRAARETVREAEHAAQERIQEATREAARDTEHAAGAKAKDMGERLRQVGEATREAAKEEAKRENLGSGRPRSE